MGWWTKALIIIYFIVMIVLVCNVVALTLSEGNLSAWF
jgi:hypothetical protein